MCVPFNFKRSLHGIWVGMGVKNTALRFGAHSFVWEEQGWDSVRTAPFKDPDPGRLWFQQLSPLSY